MSTSGSSAPISRTAIQPDQPGRLAAWLQQREPVYGWQFEGDWFDIGDHEQLLEADNRLRAARGLPVRTEYSPV